MCNKKYIYLLVVPTIILLLGISIAFSNIAIEAQKIPVNYALAISATINDLEKWYCKNYTNIKNRNEFQKKFIDEYEIINVINGAEGIRVYMSTRDPMETGGDIEYVIDRDNYTVLKRHFLR